MTLESERRPGGGGAAADNAVTSDTENSLPSAPEQARTNPLPALATELDAMLGGTWPGNLRQLMAPERPLPLAIGIRDAIAAAAGLDQDARSRLGIILQRWTAATCYLRALGRPGGLRHGIDGTTSPASPEHVAGAKQRIEERLRRWGREAKAGDGAAVAGAGPEPAPAPRLAGNRARPMLRLGAR